MNTDMSACMGTHAHSYMKHISSLIRGSVTMFTEMSVFVAPHGRLTPE